MLGKWNKSVILSYIGLSFSVLGVFLIFKGLDTKYSIVCFMYAGICDLFDGTVARRCKRTKEEKKFGIELDSLIDVFNFVAFPISKGNTPVAFGSNVPVCPTFSFNIFLTFFTTSLDVYSFSL